MLGVAAAPPRTAGPPRPRVRSGPVAGRSLAEHDEREHLRAERRGSHALQSRYVSSRTCPGTSHTGVTVSTAPCVNRTLNSVHSLVPSAFLLLV